MLGEPVKTVVAYVSLATAVATAAVYGHSIKLEFEATKSQVAQLSAQVAELAMRQTGGLGAQSIPGSKGDRGPPGPPFSSPTVSSSTATLNKPGTLLLTSKCIIPSGNKSGDTVFIEIKSEFCDESGKMIAFVKDITMHSEIYGYIKIGSPGVSDLTCFHGDSPCSIGFDNKFVLSVERFARESGNYFARVRWWPK